MSEYDRLNYTQDPETGHCDMVISRHGAYMYHDDHIKETQDLQSKYGELLIILKELENDNLCIPYTHWVFLPLV